MRLGGDHDCGGAALGFRSDSFALFCLGDVTCFDISPPQPKLTFMLLVRDAPVSSGYRLSATEHGF
jgi:hypothetical protein